MIDFVSYLTTGCESIPFPTRTTSNLIPFPQQLRASLFPFPAKLWANLFLFPLELQAMSTTISTQKLFSFNRGVNSKNCLGGKLSFYPLFHPLKYSFRVKFPCRVQKIRGTGFLGRIIEKVGSFQILIKIIKYWE